MEREGSPGTEGEGEEQQPASRQEMQRELDFLRRELQQAREAAHRTQSRLHAEQAANNTLVTALRAELRQCQAQLSAQRSVSHRQNSDLLTHLLFLEGQMRKEQHHVIDALANRDKLVDRLQVRILELERSNQQLQLARDLHLHGTVAKSNGLSQEPLEQLYGNGCLLEEGAGGQQQQQRSGRGDRVLQRTRFTTMRDKLRRHRSSLELHSTEPLATLEETVLRYGSHENLVDSGQQHRTRLQERKERCRSLQDYSHALNQYPLLELPQEEWEEQAAADSDGHLSDGKLDDEMFVRGLVEGGVTKASSVPQALGGCVPAEAEAEGTAPAKERPHSMSSIDVVALEKMGKPPSAPSPPPSNSSSSEDFNPFKSIRTILKRKGSKLRHKKRSVSLPQGANQEYLDTMKKHFDKHDMS